METEKEKAESAPRTKEMQETLNHLILGITMWLSASITCITTLITVHQPWCLLVLLLPFIFTMFPQIQKFMIARIEANYHKHKESKVNRKHGTVRDNKEFEGISA